MVSDNQATRGTRGGWANHLDTFIGSYISRVFKASIKAVFWKFLNGMISLNFADF